MTKVQKVLKNEEEVYGVLFHPDSDDHLLSYGKRHLNLWTLGIETNELIPKKTFKNVSSSIYDHRHMAASGTRDSRQVILERSFTEKFCSIHNPFITLSLGPEKRRILHNLP